MYNIEGLYHYSQILIYSKVKIFGIKYRVIISLHNHYFNFFLLTMLEARKAFLICYSLKQNLSL